MNKTAILSVLIFCCTFTNLMAVEKPLSKKITCISETKTIPKPNEGRCFGLGAQLTSLSLMGTGTTYGLGINGLFSATGKKQAYFVDFNYYFPVHSSEKEYLYAKDTAAEEGQLKINVNYKILGKSARFGYRLYFLKDLTDDGFRLYMQAFAGVQFLNVSSTSESYNEKFYTPQYEPAYTCTALLFGGGFGGEYTIGSKLNIFGDMNLNLPVFNVGVIKVDVEIPTAMKFTLGTKFLF